MGSRVLVARLLTAGAFVCGLVGLIVGLVDRTWKLGATGWFMGGTLLAVLAIAVFAEAYFASKQESSV